ncbi:MAG: GntR family transcriptional regulator [Prolixibacteraceae bacterium]|jgi:DNA-binding transcriptional regulator YhcF (GntR family)|nr:GntR family transcriptional regulator [Prolixibacteraceae bacterium]
MSASLEIIIDHNSSVPLYRQIVNNILHGIENGTLKKGDKVPSLNELCNNNNISRDTALMALSDLKSKGIVMARPGKGYFIQNTHIEVNKKVFLLFDELNAFKEDMYNAFVGNLSSNVDVDIYFHHFNRQLFDDLIEKAAGNYTDYVIMPAFFSDVHKSISKIDTRNVIILDRFKKELTSYVSIYQDFEKDVFEALTEYSNVYNKYRELVMIHPGGKEPQERIKGAQKYASRNNCSFRSLSRVEAHDVTKGVCFLIPSDRDLVKVLKIAGAKSFVPGHDIGVISFNDTMLKEVVAGGVSTISTDFIAMGCALARAIDGTERKSKRNTWVFADRGSA